MDIKQRLDVLRNEIKDNIEYYEQKHSKSKKKAYAFKIMSVTFSAMVTVLLGLNINSLSITLKNIALVMGALAAVISSIDAFYDGRSLWVKNTITLLKLRELKRKVEFYLSGLEEKNIDTNKLNRFMDELQCILKNDLKEWLRIREKSKAQYDKNDEQIQDEIQLMISKKFEEESKNK